MSDSKTTNLCDCVLSHNGLGIVGRECDCPAGNKHMADETQTTKDYMDDKWACLICSNTFRFGNLKPAPVCAKTPHGWACPRCGAGSIHPANGDTVSST